MLERSDCRDGRTAVTTRSSLLATTVGGDGHEPSATRAWGYLCRRARPRLSAEGLRRGHLDPPLDSAGRPKTEALGRVIGSLQPGRLVSSPVTSPWRPPAPSHPAPGWR
jgi:hypothetical protein